MKKITALILSFLMIFSTLTFTSCASAPFEKSETETNFVLIDVKGYGEIVVELYPEVAPITVTNFKKLVSESFYDGVIFHRIINDFMIQGGDPDGDGAGGSPETIKGEFAANGFDNPLSHQRGVISMARTSVSMDSASSQFFIMHTNTYTSSLDGQYAAFDKVVHGIEVVDKIATTQTDYSDRPVNEVVMKSVYFVTPKNPADYTREPITAEIVTQPPHAVVDPAPYTASETPTDHVLIDVKNYGQIVIELYPDIAPITVENFKKLVSEKFYDGIIFHRVIYDFMIQGGDPDGDGSGGSEQTIKGEFSANGVTNDLSHERGVVSMARTIVSMDSASSQFFIMHTSTYKDSLDGQYAAFGKVVYGMEVVDAIAESSTYAYSDRPKSDIVMSSVYFVTPN